ncbi:MAG: tRNA pseudouridine(38-40) synthase TruA [Candidatus Omnitrophota bacterium]
MRNILLTLEYDGTRYAGWQRQRRGIRTVQGALEAALKRILREKVTAVAAGRTDSGAHALAQAVSFRAGSTLALVRIQRALNVTLPRDIRVKKIRRVPEDFSARFNASSKTYYYYIYNGPFCPVFMREYCWYLSRPLDVGSMRSAARRLLGRHDFKPFQARDKKERASVCRVKDIRVRKEGSIIRIEITADFFLYKMVRNIAGFLADVGMGKITPGETTRTLRQGRRLSPWQTAPARGLFLKRVKY